MKAFQAIGKFYLPDHQEYRNFALLDEINNPLNDILRITDENWAYRSPARNADTARQNDGRQHDGWHPDGGGSTGILLWSNVYPTEVKMRRGRKIYIGEPNDVILIDNGVVLHRVSPEYIQAVNDGKIVDRFFIRCILDRYPRPQQIAGWRRKLENASEKMEKGKGL